MSRGTLASWISGLECLTNPWRCNLLQSYSRRTLQRKEHPASSKGREHPHLSESEIAMMYYLYIYLRLTQAYWSLDEPALKSFVFMQIHSDFLNLRLLNSNDLSWKLLYRSSSLPSRAWRSMFCSKPCWASHQDRRALYLKAVSRRKKAFAETYSRSPIAMVGLICASRSRERQVRHPNLVKGMLRIQHYASAAGVRLALKKKTLCWLVLSVLCAAQPCWHAIVMLKSGRGI